MNSRLKKARACQVDIKILDTKQWRRYRRPKISRFYISVFKQASKFTRIKILNSRDVPRALNAGVSADRTYRNAVCKSIKDCACLLSARRQIPFLKTLRRSPNCVVCAAALKFCSASWLNFRHLMGFASSVIGAATASHSPLL